MKKIWITSVGLLALGIFRLADDIISRLGMQEANARHFILGNFIGSFSSDDNMEDNGNGDNSMYAEMKQFKIPFCKLLPSIVQGDRKAAAKELCTYVKTYVNSQEFLDDYNQQREKAKPTSEPGRPDAELIKLQRDDVKQSEKDLAEMKKNKQIPAASIAAMEKVISDNKKMLADWEDPTPNKSKWEKKYPANPSSIIKARLEEYLALVSTVDFTASLTEPDKYKIRKFINPVYEKKSLKWKTVFRAGKEVNDGVTSFVKEWLKGEIISSVKSKMPVVVNASSSQNSNANSNDNNTPVTVKKEEAAKEKKSLFKKLKEKVRN